jgi:hypothetical protein
VQYSIKEGYFIMPTPAGAYYGVSEEKQNVPRRLLRYIMEQDSSPRLELDSLRAWTGEKTSHEALDLLYHVQSLGWVEGFREQQRAPSGALETVLPERLEALSSNGKALLADEQGFYVESRGFAHETAEELSAVSADLASLYDRHSGLLGRNMGLETSAWALVDAAGNSRVGFWPLYIGKQRFVLVLGGVPRLNQPALTELIWALSKRYAVRDDRGVQPERPQ